MGAERPAAAHHRQRVVGQRHFHLAHVGHAALAHHHVVGHELDDLLGDAAVIDADHGRDVVSHRVHDVVRLVAMERPVAGVVGDELERAHLRRPPCRRSSRASARAFGTQPPSVHGHLEVVAVNVDRVVGHRQVADADAHAIALAHGEVIDAREHAAVPRPEVEVEHCRRPSACSAPGSMSKALMRNTKSRSTRMKSGFFGCTTMKPIMPIAICTISSACGWYMKVPDLLHLELVDEGLADRDVRLVEPADAVHAVRQQHAVPVDRGVLGQLVGDEDAQLVAFDALDRRARATGRCSPRGCAFMPGASWRTTGSATRWNSFQPLFMRHGSVQPFSVTTGLYGRPFEGASGGCVVGLGLRWALREPRPAPPCSPARRPAARRRMRGGNCLRVVIIACLPVQCPASRRPRRWQSLPESVRHRCPATRPVSASSQIGLGDPEVAQRLDIGVDARDLLARVGEQLEHADQHAVVAQQRSPPRCACAAARSRRGSASRDRRRCGRRRRPRALPSAPSRPYRRRGSPPAYRCIPRGRPCAPPQSKIGSRSSIS